MNHHSSTLTLALEQAWEKIQQIHPSVPDAVIVTAPSSKNGTLRTLGHYAHGRWNVADGNLPEVMISAEGLALGARQVFVTLLHESVHGAARTRQIKETSRGGRYHNARFRHLAEEFGLTTEQNKTIGTMTPDVTDETFAQYRDEIAALEAAIVLHRSVEGSATKKSGSRNGLALICGCDRKIRMTESVLDLGPVLCGVCGTEFVPEDGRIRGAASDSDLLQILGI